MSWTYITHPKKKQCQDDRRLRAHRQMLADETHSVHYGHSLKTPDSPGNAMKFLSRSWSPKASSILQMFSSNVRTSASLSNQLQGWKFSWIMPESPLKECVSLKGRLLHNQKENHYSKGPHRRNQNRLEGHPCRSKQCSSGTWNNFITTMCTAHNIIS